MVAVVIFNTVVHQTFCSLIETLSKSLSSRLCNLSRLPGSRQLFCSRPMFILILTTEGYQHAFHSPTPQESTADIARNKEKHLNTSAYDSMLWFSLQQSHKSSPFLRADYKLTLNQARQAQVSACLFASCLPPRRTLENVWLLKRLKEGGDELDSIDAHTQTHTQIQTRGHLVAPVLVEHVAGVLRYQSYSWHAQLWQRNKPPVITHTPAWVRHDWVNR